MYLKTLQIIGFRCLKDVSLQCQPGINVILGENNSGKSAVIDALRHTLSVGSDRRDIYCSDDDLYHDGEGNVESAVFEVHATFADLSADEQAHFSVCLSPSVGAGTAQLHMRVERVGSDSRRRFRPTIWGSEKEGEGLPLDVCHGIVGIYLEPLRDPRAGLTPGRASRIARLVDILATGDEERQSVEDVFRAANAAVGEHALVQRARDEINERLKGVTGDLMAQSAELQLSPPEFRRIAQSLRARVGHGAHFEIDENGLGYNNLLYIATVLGELQKIKANDADTDLAALLIEEPEAHLHPHLQSILMEYLAEVSTGAQPVQVFMTTHSPTLAAGASLESLNVLHVNGEGQVVSYPVASCDLQPAQRKYLQRYLDVTKSQLFFARGVVLVEGISEALLLPVLAKGIGIDLTERAITVVNVQSLAFTPFARLFQEGGMQLPAAIITDADPPAGILPAVLDLNTMSAHANAALALANGKVAAFFSCKTFEYDLALAGNALRMATEYAKLRPQKGAAAADAIAAAGDLAGKAGAFLDNFDKKDKASFAQILAESLAEDWQGFQVPRYLRDALKYVTGVDAQ